MKKIICLILSSLVFLTSCSKPVVGEQEKSIDAFEVPEYSVDEYNWPDKVSSISRIGYKDGELCASGFFIDDSLKVVEENILTKETITEFEIAFSSESEEKKFFNHSYYERGIQYNEAGKRNSEVEIKESGNNDVRNHYRISDLCQSDGGNIVYLTSDMKQKHYIIVCDTDNQIIDKKEIGISSEYSVNSIYYCDDKYYISAYVVELSNSEKSYPSSIFVLDNSFNVEDEIIDIETEQINGLVYLGTDCYAVYSYDEKTDTTYFEVSDGEMITTSDIKEFEGKVRFFPSGKKDSVYAASDKKVVIYNIFSGQSESVTEIQTEENKTYEILYCDDESFAYTVKNSSHMTVDFTISDECNFVRSDNLFYDYEYYWNDEGQYIVRNITDDTETEFYDYDGELPLTYRDGLFWGVSASGKAEIYAPYGSLKFKCGQKDYNTENLLLSGYSPSIIYKVNDRYCFSTINSENGKFENTTEIKEDSYLKNAQIYYSGDEKYLFYVQVNGYILGYDIEEKKHKPIVDLADINNDSALLGIKNTTDGTYLFVTENKIYRLIEKSGDSTLKPEIVFANLTFENLYPVLCSDDSSEYAVRIVEYINKDSGQIDYSKLNQDIISGNSPDIIVTDSCTDITYLEKMDYFAKFDKAEIYDQDKEYLDNIIDAFNPGDYIYRVPAGFRINTLLTCSDKIDADWSYKEYLDLVKNKDIIDDRRSVLWSCDYMRSLVSANYENTDPDFNSDEFKEIIQTIKEYTYEPDDEVWYNDLLVENLIGPDFLNTEDGKEYHICGFPSSEAGVSYIASGYIFSVSKNSASKKECMDFIKKIASTPTASSFSLETEAFDEEINFMKSNNEIEFVNELRNIIMNASVIYTINPMLDSIVEESVNEYFETDISVDEAVEKMENMIRLYINESQ